MPLGEIGINGQGDWYSCPGRYNGDKNCRVGLGLGWRQPDVYYDWHKGYYNAILFNCDANDGT
jgi:hypothetical protein